MISPCLTLSNIRNISRVKWSNSRKRVAPSPTPGVVAIEKGAFGLPTLLTYICIKKKSGPFKYIILNTARYFRYIDDILLIYPQDLDLRSITDRLNNVEPSIKFIHELEYNSTVPFLDILLIRNINKLESKVYRKPTCKKDRLHFYSHHNNTTKRGIIIGFYLSPLYICSSKYFNDEFNHIENSFLNLLDPKSFIHFARSKALKIYNKNLPQTNAHSQSHKTSSPIDS